MSYYFLCSQNKHSKNLRFFQYVFSDFVAANFFKKESRSPRGFLPRPLIRAGETEFRTPPPFPQKNEAGGGQEGRSKKVRANVKITPPKLICIRIDRARASGAGAVNLSSNSELWSLYQI